MGGEAEVVRMLTRKSAALFDDDDTSWTDDYGITQDQFWELPEAEQKKLEQRFEADCDRQDAELKRRYEALSLAAQCRYDSRLLLQATLRTRTRIEKYTTGSLAKFDLGFMAERNKTLLKKLQHDLVDVRAKRRTGITGGTA
jgi:hypothetical protein